MSSDHPNHISPARFKELKARLNGSLSSDEALKVLSEMGRDKTTPPIIRLNIATAIIDIRSGRSVQSAMARLRRATGLDPEKKPKL